MPNKFLQDNDYQKYCRGWNLTNMNFFDKK